MPLRIQLRMPRVRSRKALFEFPQKTKMKRVKRGKTIEIGFPLPHLVNRSPYRATYDQTAKRKASGQ
jgi:hypothetical protein